GVPATRASRGAPRGDDRWPNDPWLRLAKTTLGSFRQNARRSLALMRPDASAGASTAQARRDASRSMRANRVARPHPSRRAYAPSRLRSFFRTRAPQDEDEHRVLQSSSYKQPFSFPRRIFCARGLHPCFTDPESRGGRSAEKRSGARRNTRGRARNAAHQALARRLASHDAGRSPLGAPPWRFWASGPRFRLLRRSPPYNGGQLPSAPCRELLPAPAEWPAGGLPGPPRRKGTSRRRRRAPPPPPSRGSRGRPPTSRGA